MLYLSRRSWEYSDLRGRGDPPHGDGHAHPAAGAVVREGEPLYRIDADPVLRLDGRCPPGATSTPT